MIVASRRDLTGIMFSKGQLSLCFRAKKYIIVIYHGYHIQYYLMDHYNYQWSYYIIDMDPASHQFLVETSLNIQPIFGRVELWIHRRVCDLSRSGIGQRVPWRMDGQYWNRLRAKESKICGPPRILNFDSGKDRKVRRLEKTVLSYLFRADILYNIIYTFHVNDNLIMYMILVNICEYICEYDSKILKSHHYHHAIYCIYIYIYICI